MNEKQVKLLNDLHLMLGELYWECKNDSSFGRLLASESLTPENIEKVQDKILDVFGK